MASKCRQNYHEECEAAINKQINMELHACIVYMALAGHFGRDDVALEGFRKYFMEASTEERDHAIKFMDYQNLRGGRVLFQAVPQPSQDEWESPLTAMEYALNMEKEVTRAIYDLHKLAEKHGDSHLAHFLDHNFIDEQAQAVFKLAEIVTNLQRVGDGLGVYTFDKSLV